MIDKTMMTFVRMKIHQTFGRLSVEALIELSSLPVMAGTRPRLSGSCRQPV
jgi:hypothetical protein